MKIRFRVKRMVIDGLPIAPGDQRALRDSIERELVTLLARPSGHWPKHDVTVGRLLGDTVSIATVRPRELGRAVAGSIHASLGNGAMRQNGAERP